jgi:multiple sugar transport system permease protein
MAMTVPDSRKGRRRVSKALAPYLFLAPFALLFIAFLIAPMIYAFDLAVYKTTLVAGTHFVGAENFVRAAGDPKFWGGVLVLIKFIAIQIPVMVIVALMIALILDSATVHARSFFRVTCFFPMRCRR